MGIGIKHNGSNTWVDLYSFVTLCTFVAEQIDPPPTSFRMEKISKILPVSAVTWVEVNYPLWG